MLDKKEVFELTEEELQEVTGGLPGMGGFGKGWYCSWCGNYFGMAVPEAMTSDNPTKYCSNCHDLRTIYYKD